MAEPRKPSLILPVAGAAMLLAEYFGSYYGSLVIGGTGRDGAWRPMPTYPSAERIVGERGAWLLFSPAYWIDRFVRYEFWNPRRYGPED
jgi:hypothetical protein